VVAETKETMGKVFDSWTEGFRAAMDASRRTQETWFKAFSETTKNPFGFEGFFASSEKMAKEFAPFVGRSLDTFANTCDSSVRAGLDVFRAATEVTMRPEDGDFYKKSRRVWDAAFDAVRTNVDAVGKAASRGMENCTAFYQNICGDEFACKATPKSNKPGA